MISRITKNTIQDSKLFFVTSAAARSKPRFLREVEIIPPRAYAACVETLKRITQNLEDKSRLELHFADEEGDPYTVELAGRLGGYAVGQDSDFVVLNAEGYKGYVPMDEMVWTGLSQSGEVQDPAGDDSGFQTVVNSKAKKKVLAQKPTLGNGIIPPEDTNDIQLSVSVYSPEAVASHLRIPVALLPLMGALVGNDFTGSKDSSAPTTSQDRNLQWLFFERQLTLSQRITRVANTLHDILAQALLPTAKGKHKVQVNSVMQLIERAIAALLIRSTDTIASGERERIMDRIVEATLQYAIPRYEGSLPGAQGLWASPVCALHDDDTCPLSRYLSASEEPATPTSSHHHPRLQKNRDNVRNLYISAYRSGRLDPRLLDVMNTGTFWYRPTLENPDIETASASIGRPIQEVCYALMDNGLGLPEQPAEEDEDDEDDDEDALIDVVEESDEDYLAPLRGALQELDTPVDSDDEMATEPPASVSSLPRRPQHIKPKVIEEHLRRGVRLANENVLVPSLTDVLTPYNLNLRNDLPIQLTSEEDRVSLFLQILQSDVPAVRALSPKDTLVVVALRWVVSRLDVRAQEANGSKERIKERWAKSEAQAFLASFSVNTPFYADDEVPPIENRNVQLVAQLASSFDAVERLSQLLLLSNRFPSPVLRFSGVLFHSYLTGTVPIPPKSVQPALWEAATQNLDQAFAEVLGKKKRAARNVAANSPPTPATKQRKGTVGNGMFGLLGDVEA